ncbi:MAG: response regulator [Firmicutes bacterium]|nr:response regulator [Bacillota bacterium]
MKARVMLVDDAKVMRLMLARIFEQAGYEIVGEASNGLEAVEKYKEIKPDLVMMDITMPEMSGIDAVKEIRNIDPDARIIMCTAMGQRPLVVEAITAGAMNYIVKPFTPSKVLEAAKEALRGKE